MLRRTLAAVLLLSAAAASQENILIDHHRASDRRECPLRARRTLADLAPRADGRGRGGIGQVKPARIDQPRGVADVAAQPHGKALAGRAERRVAPPHRARDPQVRPPVGHLRDPQHRQWRREAKVDPQADRLRPAGVFANVHQLIKRGEDAPARADEKKKLSEKIAKIDKQTQ